MVSRRQFVVASATALGTLAVAPRALAAAMATPGDGINEVTAWPPYAQSLAIDASGGFGRPPGTEDGSLGPLDLADARASGLSAALLTLAPSGRLRFGDAAFESAVKAIAHWDGMIATHPQIFSAVRNGADLQRAKRDGTVGLIYGFQESSPIGDDIDRVDLFQKLGMRVIQLTHNRRNLIGDGCGETADAGLSDFGRMVVEQLNAKRILVDLAHGGRRTTREAIAASKAPVLISHTGCAALADVPRNTPDDLLRAMADRGGVVGILFWPFLRRQGQPSVDDLIAHIEHAIQVCGEDHVGIGTDNTVSPVPRTPEYEKDNREFMQILVEDGVLEAGRSPDGLYTFLPDLNHARRFETIGARLAARGHSEARIHKVLGGNFARVMSEVWG